MVGLSTGQLSAAVVALAPTNPARMALGVEAVLIAFRLGLHVRTTASNTEISTAQDEDSTWSYDIAGQKESEARKALDDFHQDKVTSIDDRSTNLD